MKRAFIALAAIGSTFAIAGTAAPTLAQSPALAQSNANNMVIEYSDLNLDTAKGQKTLKRRIDKAARKFCGMDYKATGSRVRANQDTDCYHQAKNLATQQMAKLLDKTRLGG